MSENKNIDSGNVTKPINKSLEFVAHRFYEQYGENILENANEIRICGIEDFFEDEEDKDLFVSDCRAQSTYGIVVEVEQVDDSFSNFDYYIAHGEQNDGSLCFTSLAVRNLLARLWSARTFPKSRIKCVEDLAEIHKVKVKIGSIIICEREATSPIREKPWMTNKLRAFIPVHFEFEDDK